MLYIQKKKTHLTINKTFKQQCAYNAYAVYPVKLELL